MIETIIKIRKALLIMDLNWKLLKSVLGINILDKNIFVDEIFKALIDKYCSHMVYTDVNTWYVLASSKHRVFYTLEKSLIKRVIMYFRGRT